MRYPARGCGTVVLLLVAAGCGDEPFAPSDEDRLRTVVFHRQDTGENLLLNSDGSEAGSVNVPGAPAVPIAVSASGRTMAVLQGGIIGLVRLDQPGGFDTIMTRPQVHSVASFSNDAELVGIVSYAPVRAVLVFDRAARRVDTLPYEEPEAVLPPVFSPGNEQIVVIGATTLSLFSTVLYRGEQGRRDVHTFGFSRFLTIPIFGWPRWTSDEGLLMAFVRDGQADPDTLLSIGLDPNDPSAFTERFRAVLSPVSDERPELIFGPEATYAYAEDGQAIVIGANPGTGSATRHALYYLTPGVPRVRLLLDDPAQRPVFPNFIN